ncbi:hypothetical protein [Streptomyces shenzhenensis]|uniref:hypothetical protein n=1 Tax=Streptomyces shenzhenensis TaxID=943815 RepID=UPI0015F04551|nr:hypothetical protein [Streptomyces shenzhenensis]
MVKLTRLPDYLPADEAIAIRDRRVPLAIMRVGGEELRRAMDGIAPPDGTRDQTDGDVS